MLDMKKVLILSDETINLEALNNITGFNFTISGEYSPNLTVDLIILDTYHPSLSTLVSRIPNSQRSFFFPVRKINALLDSSPESFLYELSRDQTIHTRYWNFYNETLLPTEYGDFILFGFQSRIDDKRVLGLRTTEIPKDPYVRTHSMCYTGDIFHSKRCDCREELEKALELINHHGGILIYPEEEGRGIGILNKLAIYNSQQVDGYDTYDAQYVNSFPNDLRSYNYLKDIFSHFDIKQLHLITNNPAKELAIEKSGVGLLETVKIESTVNEYNRDYLMTKMNKSGHNFNQEFNTEKVK